MLRIIFANCGNLQKAEERSIAERQVLHTEDFVSILASAYCILGISLASDKSYSLHTGDQLFMKSPLYMLEIRTHFEHDKN